MATFHGFIASDFSDQVDGVHWRGRGALGGLLARALNESFGSDFSSWAVGRRTELHIARESRYSFDNPWPHAKLFIYTPPDEVALGLYLEKPDHPLDDLWDWGRFTSKLESDPVARAALLAAMRNHRLTLTDYYDQQKGGALGVRLFYWAGSLCLQRPPEDPQPAAVDDLVRLMENLEDDAWCDLHIFTAIPKADAIAMGDHIVDTMLTVFHSLVPVYEAAVAPGLG
jgi:hypothetical protein